MPKLTREESKFAKELIPQLIESALINGDITKADFSNRKKLLKKLMVSFPKKDKDLYFIIMHQDGLLDRFEDALKEEEFDLVYVFLATYFEHFINEIIHIWSVRNKISHDISKELLRKVSLEDKFSWLIEILKLPTFNKEFFPVIKEISDKRNSFLHYKYPPKAATEPIDFEKERWKSLDEKVRKTIKYCKSYRSRVIYIGEKKNIPK